MSTAACRLTADPLERMKLPCHVKEWARVARVRFLTHHITIGRFDRTKLRFCDYVEDWGRVDWIQISSAISTCGAHLNRLAKNRLRHCDLKLQFYRPASSFTPKRVGVTLWKSRSWSVTLWSSESLAISSWSENHFSRKIVVTLCVSEAWAIAFWSRSNEEQWSLGYVILDRGASLKERRAGKIPPSLLHTCDR